MSTDWLPVLIVLAVGTLVGAAIAWRLRRSSRAETPRPEVEDKALRLKDLERRKRELYERLERESDAADRELLENQAARVLRDIDRLRGELPAAAASKALEEEPVPAQATGSRGGRSMLIGFVGGAAMAGLVALLVFWAGRDAQPRQSGAAPQTSMEQSEHPAPAMTADVAARIETLRERVKQDPTDLESRKQLALALLGAEQFFEAFEVAQEILESRPDDPDALYVAGMVRMTMGQDDVALELLDRVLEQYPNHIPALAGRGMIFMRRGDRDAAILVWQRALEAAGGSHPDLEALIAMARNEPAPDAAAASPPGPATATGRASPMAPPAGGSSGGEVAAGTFAVRIELTPGVSAPPGATLFVFLRDGAAGPPAAVKKIQSPSFPLDLELGPGDSMMGRPLPSGGTITARLDTDGSASTTSDDDLAAEGEARVGERIRLLLDH